LLNVTFAAGLCWLESNTDAVICLRASRTRVLRFQCFELALWPVYCNIRRLWIRTFTYLSSKWGGAAKFNQVEFAPSKCLVRNRSDFQPV